MRLVFYFKQIHVTQAYSNKNCVAYVSNEEHTKIFRLLKYQYDLDPLYKVFSKLKLIKL